jgi:hypothetical protein
LTKLGRIGYWVLVIPGTAYISASRHMSIKDLILASQSFQNKIMSWNLKYLEYLRISWFLQESQTFFRIIVKHGLDGFLTKTRT